MPVNQFPHRALPARFRRPRVLIIGCGDVGQRIAGQWQVGAGPSQRGPRVLALTSSPDKRSLLRARGITPLLGNLDVPAQLRRLRGVAQYVLYLAPPPGQGPRDPRVRYVWSQLAQGQALQRVVYASTTGVYGDCQGAWVDETRALAPATARAQRRVDAEQVMRQWGQRTACAVSVVRIPGIYAPDRPQGTPEARLRKQLPVLQASDDVFTNHIHAEDLARCLIAAMWRGQPQRSYIACDDTELKMGDYFDLAAQLYGLPPPPRVSRAQAQAMLPPVMLSFMGESRRLRNQRMKQELRVQLQWPTVAQGLQVAPASGRESWMHGGSDR